MAPQVLAALVRHYGDFEAAEDAVQEALLAAATQWPELGVPESPPGWLITVASRRMIDQLRSELASKRREGPSASAAPNSGSRPPAPDSTCRPSTSGRSEFAPSRRLARTRPDGGLVPLAEQDRSQWNRESINEGITLITHTLARAPLGPYQLQAAIAAVHAEAIHAEATDWPQIVALYRLLEELAPNPITTLNHAVAVAMAHGPQAGLALLEPLDTDDRLSGHHRLHAVRAHLLEMADDHDGARCCYRMAARLTTSLPEQHYLQGCADRLAQDRQ